MLKLILRRDIEVSLSYILTIKFLVCIGFDEREIPYKDIYQWFYRVATCIALIPKNFCGL